MQEVTKQATEREQCTKHQGMSQTETLGKLQYKCFTVTGSMGAGMGNVGEIARVLNEDIFEGFYKLCSEVKEN